MRCIVRVCCDKVDVVFYVDVVIPYVCCYVLFHRVLLTFSLHPVMLSMVGLLCATVVCGA